MKVTPGRDLRPGRDPYGRLYWQQWQVYAENHPEVLASFNYHNGKWANCTCAKCDPEERIKTILERADGYGLLGRIKEHIGVVTD